MGKTYRKEQRQKHKDKKFVRDQKRKEKDSRKYQELRTIY